MRYRSPHAFDSLPSVHISGVHFVLYGAVYLTGSTNQMYVLSLLPNAVLSQVFSL